MAVLYYEIRENTFLRWCNDYLSRRGLRMSDFKTGFKSGLLLVNLMEIISGKSLGRCNLHPKIYVQKTENVGIAIKFIQDEGIKLVNIGAEDIVDGNMRLILGLMWTLILRYEVKGGGDGTDGDAISDLLEWVRSKIPEYDVKGFTKDWNDGRALCGLVNALRPGSFPNHMDMNPDHKKGNCGKGISAAQRFLNIDPLLLPEEMAHKKVDKIAVITYISQFRNVRHEDMQDIEAEVDESKLVKAHGPGLFEGVADFETFFTVERTGEVKKDVVVKIVDENGDIVSHHHSDVADGCSTVTYTPKNAGEVSVSISIDGKDIEGSLFKVTVLESESLGGEGKIRVFFSTTSSNEKTRTDTQALKVMMEIEKIHLRPDFEPWHPVDLMEKEDRDAVFRVAGTRHLPIVIIDDQYMGSYDEFFELKKSGKLAQILKTDKIQLISPEEHARRMRQCEDTAEAKSNDLKGERQAKLAAESRRMSATKMKAFKVEEEAKAAPVATTPTPTVNASAPPPKKSTTL